MPYCSSLLCREKDLLIEKRRMKICQRELKVKMGIDIIFKKRTLKYSKRCQISYPDHLHTRMLGGGKLLSNHYTSYFCLWGSSILPHDVDHCQEPARCSHLYTLQVWAVNTQGGQNASVF